MFKLFYTVRVVEDGKVKETKRFALKDRMANFVKRQSRAGRRVVVKTRQKFILETFQNTAWGPAPHDPWVAGPKPVAEVFIHHSVTKQLPITASTADEKEQMKLLDQIAHGRGFNGISYCWAIFPSSRAWEGRGFGIIEAGTEGHNTSGDSIVLAGNYSEFKPSDVLQKAVIALIRKGQRDGFFVKSGLKVRPHRSVSQTSCPGSKTTDAWVAEIQKAVN